MKIYKHITVILLFIIIYSCSRSDWAGKAEMAEASELSLLMREMVEYSKSAKANLKENGRVDLVPEHFYDLLSKKASRDEHLDSAFLRMGRIYLESLKGIDRADSQAYYYNLSIDACKSCHSVYCGGPMAIIKKLPLKGEH